MAKQHAILSPSAAYRWLACTPSARFEEQIPDVDSIFSREGTLAHELAALILSSRTGLFKKPQKAFNKELSKIEELVAKFYAGIGKPNAINEMMDYAEDYAAYVRQFIPIAGKSVVLIERRVDMSSYAPLCYGTVDCGIITPRVIYVIDYKYGAGKRVSAIKNRQMMLYALGLLLVALEKGYEPDKVVVSIFQPRVSETASTWEIDTEDLLDWAETELKEQAVQAIGGQGDFVAGSHCDFCKAKTSCKAYYDHFADLKNISDKRQMTSSDVVKVLTHGTTLMSWVKKVIDDQRIKMLNGARVKGFKLVAGRSLRKFTNENDVVDILLGEGVEFENMYKVELRGITDLEGFFGKKRFQEVLGDVVIRTEGAPNIVPEDDDRPAIGASAGDDYDETDYTDLL